MPYHQHVTTCRKSGGPISKFCSCEHCTLAVCAVCRAYEGSLTTDCPGSPVDFDKQKEVHETALDYTDARGWHLGDGASIRLPCFTPTPQLPPRPRAPADPRAIVAPSIDWATIDRHAALQYALTQRAIAWVLADRACEERSAALTRVEDSVDPTAPEVERSAAIAALERERIAFRLADQLAQRCDDEFRQAARRLVTALEGSTPADDSYDGEL